ncbi:MAG: DUF4242 domain-containing protein [Spirochaetota bacterium]|nr:DUF4242 domain-containing protein [Spirochaetota bacterium]
MPKFMVECKKDPKFVSHHVNHLCKVCANEKRALWIRVNYNIEEGKIFCLWDAPDRDILLKILGDCNISYDEVVEVEEMGAKECCWDVFGDMED